MVKRKKDPLICVIEQSLDCGQFVSYGTVDGFIDDLEKTKVRIDDLVKQGEAKRSVGLYEIFMAGCYEKMDEIDDSGGAMGVFFEDLFCSWIRARQKTGLAPEETVNQMLKMMDNDDYGLCYEIEKDAVEVLHQEEIAVFQERIYARFEKAFSSQNEEGQETINDFSHEIRNNARILKVIYSAKRDVDAYLALCEKVGMTPKDCQVLADIYKGRRQWVKALDYVNQGLSLEKEKSWPNESGFGLSDLKCELLNKLGRKEEALQTAWEDFLTAPSKYSYKDLMKYVPKEDAKLWHDKAIVEVKKRSLCDFIDICTMTKELDILAEHILGVKHHDLEDISHYTTEEAAKKLSKNHWAASARIYRALGLRILNSKSSKKSQYYEHALKNFEEAKKLYQKSDLEEEWKSLVEIVRRDHSRKHNFIEDFEDIVQGISREEPSFLERTQSRWKKQMA